LYSLFSLNPWLINSSQNAVEIGAKAMTRDMGLDADQLISEVSFALIPDMTVEAPDTSQIVSEALGGTTVYKLLDSVRAITSRTGGQDIILAAALPSLPDTTRKTANLTEKQNELKEQLQKAMALTQAYQMMDMLDQTDEMIAKSIDDANHSVDRSVDSTLSSAGYARTGDIYGRTVIIDDTLFGDPETEHHEIGAYEDYKAPGFNHGIDLSKNTMENLNSTIIQARVQLAQQNMTNYLNLIFGKEKDEDGNAKDIRTGLDQNFLDLLEKQEQAFKDSSQYNTAYTDDEDVEHKTGKHTDTQGLFNFHVGYAPEMEEDEPEEVKVEGYGQMGRIYKDFMIQQARLYRGFATVDAPIYNKKFWDDDADNDGHSDGLMGAPTMRSATDIAMTIAANSIMGPGIGSMLMKAALNMADDALFTGLDVMNGMDAGDAWGGFAKKGATSIVSQGIGKYMSGLDNLKALQFTDGAVGSQIMEFTTDVGIAGATTAANTYSAAAINSISGDGFDWSTFNSMTSWDNTSTSYLSSMAGAGVNSVFDQINMTDSNNIALSENVFKTGNIKDFNALASGLTSSGIEYAMTGQTKLNIMNLGMFGLTNKDGENLQSGLLELNLGGNGSIFDIGTGGTDVSLGKLQSALQGLDETRKIGGYKFSGENKNNLLNGINMMGYSDINTNYDTARSIFDKDIKTELTSGLRNSENELVRGFVSTGDKDTINVNSDILGKGLENAAQLASLLSHEGTHTDGDRTEFNAYLNEAATYNNLSKKFDIGEGSYQSYLVKQLLDEQNAQENMGKEDNAEWYVNDKMIGIKPSSFIKDPFSSISNSISRFFGGNPDTQNKIPEGEYDYTRNELADKRANKDMLNSVVTLATAARAAQLSGGNMTFNEYLGNYYSVLPVSTKNMNLNDAIGLVNNIAGYLGGSNQDGSFSLKGLSNFSQFKDGIQDLDGFHDVQGYNESQDNKILKYLEEAGIPTKIENSFRDDEVAKAKAINSLMDNFNFGSSLMKSDVPAGDAGILYHLGAIQTYHDENGKKWIINEPGMNTNSNTSYQSDKYDEFLKSMKYLNNYNKDNTIPLYNSNSLDGIYKVEALNSYFSYMY